MIDRMERHWSRKAFGIGKLGAITRAISNFSRPPGAHPMTVCFHLPSIGLTHAHVVRLIGCLIGQFAGSRVTSLQFVDRNVKHGTRGLDNRWLVTVNTGEARDYLVSSGLPLFNRLIDIRLYDDVLGEEYDAFLKYSSYRKHINPGLREGGASQ